MQSVQGAKILCVDDEPLVLEGVARHFRKRYDVLAATSAAAGLELLHQHSDVAVIITDMRMPGADGAAFLRLARQVAPDAVRLVLTGYADVTSAIAAVNEGQVFRFLTKPCSPPALILAVGAAARQHRLLTSERVLLEQTLHGSIKALTEVLTLANPAAFGRASRIRDLVSELAGRLEMAERWQCEVAAMLSQLGTITLSSETAEKLFYGQPLTATEQELADRLPAETERLLGSIPRIEVVRGILTRYSTTSCAVGTGPGDHENDLIWQGAQLVRVAVDFDTLELQGNTAAAAIAIMRRQPDIYDYRVLAALEDARGVPTESETILDVHLTALQVGMILAEDVKLRTGALFAARGSTVTQSFIGRLRNLGYAIAKDALPVIVRRSEGKIHEDQPRDDEIVS